MKRYLAKNSTTGEVKIVSEDQKNNAISFGGYSDSDFITYDSSLAISKETGKKTKVSPEQMFNALQYGGYSVSDFTPATYPRPSTKLKSGSQAEAYKHYIYNKKRAEEEAALGHTANAAAFTNTAGKWKAKVDPDMFRHPDQDQDHSRFSRAAEYVMPRSSEPGRKSLGQVWADAGKALDQPFGQALSGLKNEFVGLLGQMSAGPRDLLANAARFNTMFIPPATALETGLQWLDGKKPSPQGVLENAVKVSSPGGMLDDASLIPSMLPAGRAIKALPLLSKGLMFVGSKAPWLAKATNVVANSEHIVPTVARSTLGNAGWGAASALDRGEGVPEAVIFGGATGLATPLGGKLLGGLGNYGYNKLIGKMAKPPSRSALENLYSWGFKFDENIPGYIQGKQDAAKLMSQDFDIVPGGNIKANNMRSFQEEFNKLLEQAEKQGKPVDWLELAREATNNVGYDIEDIKKLYLNPKHIPGIGVSTSEWDKATKYSMDAFENVNSDAREKLRRVLESPELKRSAFDMKSPETALGYAHQGWQKPSLQSGGYERWLAKNTPEEIAIGYHDIMSKFDNPKSLVDRKIQELTTEVAKNRGFDISRLPETSAMLADAQRLGNWWSRYQVDDQTARVTDAIARRLGTKTAATSAAMDFLPSEVLNPFLMKTGGSLSKLYNGVPINQFGRLLYNYDGQPSQEESR